MLDLWSSTLSRNASLYDCDFRGETIVSNSTEPELDLASALKARRLSGVVTLIDASTGKPNSFVDIETAALLTVIKEGPVRFTSLVRPDTPYSPETDVTDSEGAR